MILDFVILGGYGHFVWPAFIFTFAICFVLYLRTEKEFKKLERIFLSEFKPAKRTEIKLIKEKRTLSESPIF